LKYFFHLLLTICNDLKTRCEKNNVPPLFFALACQQAPLIDSTNEFIVREKNDAATLNPVAASDQLSSYAGIQIFQNLTNIDFKT
tara:strand:+ start:941 stop:1195 length:255 start_codon:yes stop_codon:yes gene_type:complete